MIPDWVMVYPYYDNPKMLEHQRMNWDRYAGELGWKCRLIIVDDGSPKHPAKPLMEGCKIKYKVFRVEEDLPWNMHQARNIGAKEACTAEENKWLFMSDIDIILTPEMAYTMMTRNLCPLNHYTMERTFAPDFHIRKVHPNTFLVKHAAYWAINGYDLDLTGGYGGGYGGDGEFMRQLNVVAPRVHLQDVVLHGYGRSQRHGEPVIEDADTRTLDRDKWSKAYRRAFDEKRARGDMRSVNPIRVAYREV